MPRAHTEQERELIYARLIAAGREGFIRLGLTKLTIAEIAREAGIGKGSFYGFFDSKEALFLTIQEHDEEQFESALIEEIEATTSGREAVVALLMASFTRLEQHPFLSLLLDPQNLRALSLRVDPQLLAEHRHNDQAFYLDLITAWQERGWLEPSVNPQVVFDVLAAIFAISTQRELLGEALALRAATELVEAVADRWCGAAKATHAPQSPL